MGYFRCDRRSRVSVEYANTRPDFARISTVAMLKHFFSKLDDNDEILKRLPTFVRVLTHYHIKRRRSLRFNIFQEAQTPGDMISILHAYLSIYRHDLLRMDRYGWRNGVTYYHTPENSHVIDLTHDDNTVLVYQPQLY